MYHDRERTAQRLAEWMEGLGRFEPPEWEALPELELYMDQVVLLLSRYLAPMYEAEDEKFITASIINNYVRMKVMPPPVKKKYSRSHLAYLVIICTLKQSLSISSIQRLLPEDRSEDSVRELYETFTGQYRAAVAFLRQMPSGRLQQEEGRNLVMTSAILATLSKSLTEYLLQDGADEREYDEYDG